MNKPLIKVNNTTKKMLVLFLI